MLATKEAAREAKESWDLVVKFLEDRQIQILSESPLAQDLNLIREFIEHAEKRLPSQAAVDRDRARKRVKKDFPKKGDPWPAKAEE